MQLAQRRGKALLPGLVNCHAHMSAVIARGFNEDFGFPNTARLAVSPASLLQGEERTLMVMAQRLVTLPDLVAECVEGVFRPVQPDDRATLVLFAERAEAMNQPTSDQAELTSIVDGAELGSSITRYAPALKVAKKILEDSKLPRKEVVLITDFQKIGWEGQEEIIQLPAETTVTPVALSDRDTSNVSVTSVILNRESVSGRERVAASARQ